MSDADLKENDKMKREEIEELSLAGSEATDAIAGMNGEG